MGRTPIQGRTLNLKPRAYERWEGETIVRLTACLLHNDPASSRSRLLVNPFRGGAVAKASPKWANMSGARDAKPGDLPMGRLERALTGRGGPNPPVLKNWGRTRGEE